MLQIIRNEDETIQKCHSVFLLIFNAFPVILNIFLLNYLFVEENNFPVFKSIMFLHIIPKSQNTPKQNLSSICFISSFFPITSGILRHPISHYANSAKLLFSSFLPSIPLFVFTPNEGFESLRPSLPKESKNIHFITKYQNVFAIPQIAKYKEQYEFVNSLKNQTYPVSAEIGAIWNSKLVLIPEVYEQIYPYADFYFWIDIGIIKNTQFFQFSKPFVIPDVHRILKIFSYWDRSSKQTHIYQKLLIGLRKGKPFPIARNRIRFPFIRFKVLAGLFGGPVNIFKSLIPKYWQLHDYLLKKNQFVLREEFVLAALFLLTRGSVMLIPLSESNCSYFQAAAAFIASDNICHFTNRVFHINKFPRSSFVIKKLDSWK